MDPNYKPKFLKYIMDAILKSCWLYFVDLEPVKF